MRILLLSRAGAVAGVRQRRPLWRWAEHRWFFPARNHFDRHNLGETDRGEVVQFGRFQRAIGFVIIAAAVGAALLLWLAVSATEPEAGQPPAHGVVLGGWNILYDSQAPSARALLAASGLALLFAAGVAWAERRIANRYRRTADQVFAPLAPKIVMAETAGVYAGPVTVTVLIPAHNEEASLPATLASLQAQSLRPARVIVVADNCTDGTVAVAHAAEVEVFESVGNTDKKAGALNQALAVLLDTDVASATPLGDNDVVMVMDADTVLNDGFLEAAAARFAADRALMAVGGLFYGEEGEGLLRQFQRNEDHRHAREGSRRPGPPLVDRERGVWGKRGDFRGRRIF